MYFFTETLPAPMPARPSSADWICVGGHGARELPGEVEAPGRVRVGEPEGARVGRDDHRLLVLARVEEAEGDADPGHAEVDAERRDVLVAEPETNSIR